MRLLMCALWLLTSTAVCFADDGVVALLRGDALALVPQRLKLEAPPAVDHPDPCVADPAQQVTAFDAPLGWWPGDSGLDYLQRCAVGCQG